MSQVTASMKARAREAAKSFGASAIGAATVGMLRTTRYFDPVKTTDLFARVTRFIGPRLREHRIGRANLAAAFPEKSAEEIERILMGVWDNLGRVGAELAADPDWAPLVLDAPKVLRVDFWCRSASSKK